jgi:hypothetical protein
LSPENGDKEKSFWKVDGTIFRPAGIQTRLQRIVTVLKSLSKGALLTTLFAYPVVLVYVGVAYGGIVFWGFLGASFVTVGVVLSRTGYSRNFDGVQGSMARMLVALTIAFVLVVGFYLGLLLFKLMIVPMFFGVLGVALALVMLRARV